MTDYLFDLGNTRLKWATIDSPLSIQALAHDDMRIALPPEVRGETAWVASVAPTPLRAHLLDVLSERFVRVHCAQTQKHFGDLTIAYPVPGQLGVDRFLSLLACVPVTQATLVASVGTALTLDALAPTGRHIGGLIAPSPQLMRLALEGVSERLPSASGEVKAFADNTVDALASGCVLSAVALIQDRWRALEQHVGTPVACILHGGGAAQLHPHLPNATLEKNLVLRGLNVWRKALQTPRMS
ncbi:type III pantothenate kinase [Lysobacter sp. HDW10]|uniref:type III pantothenate kinase n=1 Tax=Lysobacter sp. HDW10 TaxID=2714936 RepID=UPI001408B6A8|nr:type III pantothenate kinase [Lysobacter sp. HDW10]QIK80464.1 type III pantothenate kinase [Lysobacter sp. HDW10]